MSNFMKICPVGAELFHKDGQIAIIKRICAFRTFENAPNMSTVYYNWAFIIFPNYALCNSHNAYGS